MAPLLTNIGISAERALGQKTTRYAQQGPVYPLSGELGLCGAVIEDTAACRAAIATYSIPHGKPPIKTPACNAPEHMNVYKRYTPAGVPPRPTVSATSDMSAFVRALAPATADLGADINGLSGPWADIYAGVIAWARENIKDMFASVYGYDSQLLSMYANIRGVKSTSTEPETYEAILIATSFGLSVVYRLLTKFPDIVATIHGWGIKDLVATIQPQLIYHSDLTASIVITGKISSYIYASITATYTRDISAVLTTIPYSTLEAALQTIPPGNLPTSIFSIGPSDLKSFCGGHFPEDLGADLLVNQPVPLKAWLRIGGIGTGELSAGITATGGYLDVGAAIRVLTESSSEVFVKITCRVPISLAAYIHGRCETGLLASIAGVRSSAIGGWVTPWHRDNYKDMCSFVRASWDLTSELSTSIYGWISTHTSDKPYNKHLYARMPKGILLGQFGGLTILRIETIWGNFPDLHATITGTPFYIRDLRAYILPVLPVHVDIGSTIRAVTQTLHITKILINLVNLSDLSVYISAFSGYSPMFANIRGVASVSTETPGGSGWVYRSYSVKFYLGTNRGLFIPPQKISSIRQDIFLNRSLRPDLRAYLYGWEVASLGAFINVQPYSYLSGSVYAQDISHLLMLGASLTSIYVYDLYSSINGIGGMYDLLASISSLGSSSGLAASIQPYLKILGYRIIPVETQPFLDLRALVNPIASCAGMSSYKNISVFIRGMSMPTSQCLLYASIYPRTDILDMSASIIGRMYTRIKLLDLYFRTMTRSSTSISSLIIGVGVGYSGIFAAIKGVSHENDIYASITASRYRVVKPEELELIKVYKQSGAFVLLYKELRLTFSAQTKQYMYDAIDGSVYPIGDGRWALNLAEFTEKAGFYDRVSSDKSRSIANIIEYGSIDEAIRDAIRVLTEPFNSSMAASIQAIGGYSNIRASLVGLYADRVLDLGASVTLVNNIPDLYATISAFSGYGAMKAAVVGINSGSPDVTADIRGVVYKSMQADITAVT